MDEDYAIIVGLQNYPGLDDPINGQAPLSGAEHDAKAFNRWVTSVKGGNVPADHAELILSSDYPGPFAAILNAKPAELEVAKAFEKLRNISTDNINKGNGPRVGKRLYIFMSGHGITPTRYGTKNEREVALLMSNVDPTNIAAPRYHIPGTYAATWFCENECFNEVFLFMDCCRDIETVPSINSFFPVLGNSDNAVRFYAFATNWSRRAKEKLIDGQVQGIFTKTLLLGLDGAAAEPDSNNAGQGVITVASLKSYLYQNMKSFIDPQFLIEDPKIQEPDVEYYPKAMEGKDIIIKTAPIQKFPFIIKVPPGASGEVTVMDRNFTTISKTQVVVAPADVTVDLLRGKYIAMVSINNVAKQKVFDVKGIEEPDSKGVVDFIF